MNREFIEAMIIRAVRTGAQTILSMLTVGMAITDLNWLQAISITLTAMLISVLTSIVTGLPEAGTDGAFIVDDTDPDTTRWILEYDGDPDDLKVGDKLTFEVKEGDK